MVPSRDSMLEAFKDAKGDRSSVGGPFVGTGGVERSPAISRARGLVVLVAAVGLAFVLGVAVGRSTAAPEALAAGGDPTGVDRVHASPRRPGDSMIELLAGLIEATLRIAAPILLAALGEIVAERAGVLNVGLEGMILVGAFAAFAGALAMASPIAGLAVGVAAGIACSALFAFLVLWRNLDQIVSGVGLNLLALGVTGVLARALPPGGATFVTTLPLIQPPFGGPLGDILRQNALGWAAFGLTCAVAILLTGTRAGLLIRAVGENPHAVDTAGIDVRRVRALSVLFAGACAGAAGAYLSVGYSNTFVEGMSAGRGFVALAIVVFARWNPWAALGGALLFGFAMSLQVRLQGQSFLGVEIPYQFFQALPYALTLVVLARSGRVSTGAPAALAQPFHRERGCW
jgi:simple sugar transport system permease protein